MIYILTKIYMFSIFLSLLFYKIGIHVLENLLDKYLIIA